MARLTKYERWNRANLIHRALFGPGIQNHEDVLKVFEEGILAAGELTLLYWFEQILPEHFTRPAASRYGYKKRKQRYIRQKLKRHPESKGLDLIYSGQYRDTITVNPRTFPKGRRVMDGFVFKVGLRTLPYVVKNRYVNIHGEVTARDAKDTARLMETLTFMLSIHLGYRDA